jgi:AmmeMemoRadiSam system protein A
MDFTPSQCTALLDAARQVIRATLRGETPSLSSLDDPALLQPAGCFVSLHALETHRLRGCVGRLDAAQPLLHALAAAAVNVLRDPRFRNDPVTLEELPLLELELSVLAPLRPVTNVLEFDLLTDGIHLTCAGRSGCFLPQVARETGWTHEQLLTRLCTEKLGLPGDFWKQDTARLSVFTTRIIGPTPFESREQATPIGSGEISSQS